MTVVVTTTTTTTAAAGIKGWMTKLVKVMTLVMGTLVEIPVRANGIIFYARGVKFKARGLDLPHDIILCGPS